MEADVLGATVISWALVGLLAAAPLSWGDGRWAYVDVRLLAEVGPSPEGTAALRRLDPAATPGERSARVVLWSLSQPHAAQLLAELDAALPGRFTAVFHDEPHAGSKLRVPAGGVLVWLDASIDPARWAAQHQHVVLQNFGNGTLLLQSAPGEATLALAAAVRRDKRVKRAMPNWWLRAVKR